jgi:hypothetical protein
MDECLLLKHYLKALISQDGDWGTNILISMGLIEDLFYSYSQERF